ncbi:MAG: DNA repair protein RecN, partial [Bacteroidales bacterium]|nr:DNA repair protein RecN [Bacteroidales bacterium]
MLQRLHIRHFVLIDALDVEFPGGLVIITGQTGAGKSILLGALSLLTGGKGDASQIAPGADSCIVEAEFAADASLRPLLEREDLEWADGQLVIRRVLYASGRSRSFVNDAPVTLPFLGELSAHLVDIHSQHASLLLTDKDFQRTMLDRFAGAESLAAGCAAAWRDWSALQKSLSQAKERLAALQAEQAYNEAQLQELDAASLRPGELEALEQEQQALANAEEIKENLSQAAFVFDPDDGSAFPGLEDAVGASARFVRKAARFLPSLEGVGSRLDAVRIELADIRQEILSTGEGIDSSAARLQEVETRLSRLYALLRKHGCQDIDALLAVRERYAAAVSDTGSLGDEICRLEQEASGTQARYEACCAALSEARRKAAPDFAAAIGRSLAYMELENARFLVDLQPAAPGPAGRESVCFAFSANRSEPVDVAKCASGGELSRIMLSLKEMMANYFGMPTMIFDEIDSGVSGSVADKMGRIICAMGARMQVMAITHLPQVAAKGDAHYLVRK